MNIESTKVTAEEIAQFRAELADNPSAIAALDADDMAIYFCVLSSVLLASFEVLPLRRTQVGRKSWVLRPTCVLRFLRRNPTR